MANFEIYKRGQGIYVRLGTAVGAALILLLGLNWLWDMVGRFQPSMAVAATQATTQHDVATSFNWHDSWLFVQAGTVLVVGALSALGIFMAVNNPKFAEFQIMTESEMRKVTWPSRRSVIRSTQVIIFMTFLFAAILWGVDLSFVWFFKLIGIITNGSTS